uniref:C1q domain-containing protein n=1 Tax=Poecilia reticulata TaxID=8081 RepID=A0A3P9PCL4_POERE
MMLDKLNRLIPAQAAELAAVKVKAENQVEALKREGEAFDVPCLSVCLSIKQLAFSASLLPSLDHGETGPYNTDITLVFRNVFTNIGNAYNPDTGAVHIHGHGSSTNPTSAVLIKNREKIFTAWTSLPSGGQKASNGVSLLLEIGDVVFLRMWANARIFDDQNRHTTFSGRLLFTM